jgi:hypothetical protein
LIKHTAQPLGLTGLTLAAPGSTIVYED